MIKFLTKYGFMTFGLLVLAGSALGYGMVDSTVSDQDRVRAQEIQTLEQAYTSREQELRAESQQVYDNLLGTSNSRVQQDTVIIEDLLSTALSWDSHESYVEARSSVIETYDLRADDHFIQTYLPPAPVNTDGAGNEYRYLDVADLNSRLGEFDVEVLSVTRTEYRYLVSVTAESVSNDDMQASANSSVVLLTIDGEGQITEISGYAEDVDFPRQHSGSGFPEEEGP